MILIAIVVIAIAIPYFETVAAIAIPVSVLSLCGGIVLTHHAKQQKIRNAEIAAQNNSEHQALDNDRQS